MTTDIETGNMRDLTAMIVEQLRENRDQLTRLSERVEKVQEGMIEIREIKVKMETLQNSVNSLQTITEKHTNLEHRVHLVENSLDMIGKSNESRTAATQANTQKRAGDRVTFITLLIALMAAFGTLYQAWALKFPVAAPPPARSSNIVNYPPQPVVVAPDSKGSGTTSSPPPVTPDASSDTVP